MLYNLYVPLSTKYSYNCMYKASYSPKNNWQGPEQWLESNQKAQLLETLGITYNFGVFLRMEE